MTWWCVRSGQSVDSCLPPEIEDFFMRLREFLWSGIMIIYPWRPDSHSALFVLATCLTRWPGGLAEASHWSESHQEPSYWSIQQSVAQVCFAKISGLISYSDPASEPLLAFQHICPVHSLIPSAGSVSSSSLICCQHILSPCIGQSASCVTSVWQNALHMTPNPPTTLTIREARRRHEIYMYIFIIRRDI